MSSERANFFRLRVDSGVTRGSRLSASWQRPGSRRVTRVLTGLVGSRCQTMPAVLNARQKAFRHRGPLSRGG
jgi:hypothetical protein